MLAGISRRRAVGKDAKSSRPAWQAANVPAMRSCKEDIDEREAGWTAGKAVCPAVLLMPKSDRDF
jgi:hypothetical protein